MEFSESCVIYMENWKIRKILYIDANNLYGCATSEFLPYDEIKFDKKVYSEKFLSTPNDGDIGFFLEVDLSYPDEIKKLRISPLLFKRKKTWIVSLHI